MQVGKLNKRINILEFVDAENNIGINEIKPQIFLTCWASIEPARGREYYDAQRVRSETSYKITIRYRKGITEAMSIEYHGRRYEIQNIVDPEEEHISLEIYCSEKTRGKGNPS